MTEHVEHSPRRPQWICTGCDAPWPCAPVKVILTEQYQRRRADLALYLAAQMYHAVAELPGVSPAAFFDRFISWTR